MANMQKISCRSMKRDAQEMSDALKAIPKILEQLQASMKNLSGCWEGQAWASFQTQVNEDMEMMREVYQGLVEYQKKLGEARDTYLHTEYDVYTDIKSIWI